jgi:Tol biopolymer transport system component
MAKLLKDVDVKAGRLITVWNTEKKAFSNSKDHYTSVWVEDEDGENERCLLFTKKEIERAEYRALRNPEDLTEKGWWSNLID